MKKSVKPSRKENILKYDKAFIHKHKMSVEIFERLLCKQHNNYAKTLFRLEKTPTMNKDKGNMN